MSAPLSSSRRKPQFPILSGARSSPPRSCAPPGPVKPFARLSPTPAQPLKRAHSHDHSSHSQQQNQKIAKTQFGPDLLDQSPGKSPPSPSPTAAGPSRLATPTRTPTEEPVGRCGSDDSVDAVQLVSVGTLKVSATIAPAIDALEADRDGLRVEVARLREELIARDETIAASHAETKSLKAQLGKYTADRQLNDLHLRQEKEALQVELGTLRLTNATNLDAVRDLRVEYEGKCQEIERAEVRGLALVEEGERKCEEIERRWAEERARAEEATSAAEEAQARLKSIVDFVEATAGGTLVSGAQ